MAKLHINQISKKLREIYPEQIDQENDSRNPESTNTRLLAYWSVDKIAQQKSGDSVRIDITDGENDRGIDAVGVNVDENILILSQSKWKINGNGSIDQAGMLKFISGVKFLLDATPDDGAMGVSTGLTNSELYDDIREVINEPGVKIYLIVATTGFDNISDPVLHEMNCLLDSLNEIDPEEPMAEFIYLNQSKIYKMISGKKKSVNFELPILDYGFYRDESDKTVYYGRVSAGNIVKAYREHEQNLFADNLRVGIPRSDINSGIRNSITNEPGNFFLYNNGITIIAEDISKSGTSNRESVNLLLKNASIVNGAQTVSTLGKFEPDSADLDKVSVLVRCIKVTKENESLGKKITRYANTQNVVSNQDFAYLDENQHRLSQELGNENYTYHLRSSERLENENNENTINLREAATALACANSNIKYAVIAKGAVGKLFDTSDPSGNYYSLFNNNTKAETLVKSVLILRCVESVLEEKKREFRSGPRRGVAINARFLVTHLIIKELQPGIMSNPDLSDQSFLGGIREKAIEYWDKMSTVFEDSDIFNDTHPGNVFKNQTRVRRLIEAL